MQRQRTEYTHAIHMSCTIRIPYQYQPARRNQRRPPPPTPSTSYISNAFISRSCNHAFISRPC